MSDNKSTNEYLITKIQNEYIKNKRWQISLAWIQNILRISSLLCTLIVLGISSIIAIYRTTDIVLPILAIFFSVLGFAAAVVPPAINLNQHVGIRLELWNQYEVLLLAYKSKLIDLNQAFNQYKDIKINEMKFWDKAINSTLDFKTFIDTNIDSNFEK